MTRPTPGREVPHPDRGRHRTFPPVLAPAPGGATEPAERGPGPAGAAHPAAALARRYGTAAAAPSAGVEPGRAGPGAPCIALVPGPALVTPGPAGLTPDPAVAMSGPAAGSSGPVRAGDTPEPDAGHLIEVVGPDAAPLWRPFLRRRDRSSRERLIEHYGSLVRGVGGKLAVRLPATVELADLVQSGTFGLMEAVERFDPCRAVRFDGYAAQRVRGAMLDELRAQDWVPRTIRARSREVDRARETLALRSGRAPTDRELAAELGVGLRELRHAVRPVHLVSAETLEPGAGDVSGPVLDAYADESAPDPVSVAVRRETTRELCTAVAQLGERDRSVLRLYYLENRTLAEIGGILGVTESRVCQLHARVVARLRGRMERALAG